jgi:hypothetical protein
MDARLICGQDVRQSGIWPTDESRIEAFVGRYGGTLEAGPVGNVAVMFRWTQNGRTVVASGVTARDALRKLREEIDRE